MKQNRAIQRPDGMPGVERPDQLLDLRFREARLADEIDANLVDELRADHERRVTNQPLCRGVFDVTDLKDALRSEPWFYRSSRERQSFEESPQCRAVFELPADRIRESDDVRPDIVDTFASRDFQLRHVQTDWLTIEPNLIQEDQSCFCPR